MAIKVKVVKTKQTTPKRSGGRHRNPKLDALAEAFKALKPDETIVWPLAGKSEVAARSSIYQSLRSRGIGTAGAISVRVSKDDKSLLITKP